jgi:hypothetical protein
VASLSLLPSDTIDFVLLLVLKADSLRNVLGPNAYLYENDAFHEGLINMPHVPSSLNFFSADGDYGWLPFEGPTGIKEAYEEHILSKLAPNQTAFVVPGTYECDGPTMEAPQGSYWHCTVRVFDPIYTRGCHWFPRLCSA